MERKRIIEVIHKGKDRASPHSFWRLCATELSRVFSEIINDQNLLSECYCPIRSRDFDEEFIVEVTTGIPSALICNKDITPDKFLSDNLPISNYNHPFLIINDVGTGKTTYCYYYFLIGIKEYHLDDKIDGILINIREFGEGEDIPFPKIEEFVHKKIDSYLTKNYPDISSPDIKLGEELFKQELIPYRGVIKYKKERNKVDYEDYLVSKIDSFISDIKLFNRVRLKYIMNVNNKKVFIVIDNVDHFGKKTQEKIFSLCTKLLNELETGIIMSARDYTLPSAFRHVPLSAFEPRFLHLSLPDTKGVLQKRISFLLKSNFIEKIFKHLGKNQIEIHAPSGIRYVFDHDSLQKEFNTILNALLTNNKIIEMLENLSDYDVRAMLKMVRVALSSGYLFPEDRERRDTVRERDFLRAIMCGNNPYYFPNDPSTMVINLFDNEEPNYDGNNLIRLRTLQAIKVHGDKAPIEEVLNFMESLNYHKEKVKKVLQLLMDWDLVESPYYEGCNIEKDDVKTLKLTLAGQYYLNTLIFNDIYLGEVKNATYMDSDYIDMINDFIKEGKNPHLSKKERISYRLEATNFFIEFIINEAKKEEQRIKTLGRESLINYDKVTGILENIKNSFERTSYNIISSLEKQ